MSSRLCVLLTREPEDNLALARELRSRGVVVREIPCLKTHWIYPAEEPDPPAAIAFASRRSVQGFWKAALHERLRIHELQPMIAAVGERTAAMLRKHGVEPDLVATPPTGGSLAQALHEKLAPGVRILLPRGMLGGGEAETALTRLGRPHQAVVVYENRAPDLPDLTPFEAAAVFVTAPSTAQRLLERFPWLRDSSFLPIGPTTRVALQKLEVATILGEETSARAQAAVLERAWRDALDSRGTPKPEPETNIAESRA